MHALGLLRHGAREGRRSRERLIADPSGRRGAPGPHQQVDNQQPWV